MAESPAYKLGNVKKALIDAGFEVFRTRGEEIVLAERPRDNLILDSGVRLRVGEFLEIRVVTRAQRADFPSEEEARLFERARRLGASSVAAGFSEVDATATRIGDPGDPERTLDTFYEVTFAKRAGAVDDAIADLRFALALEKRA